MCSTMAMLHVVAGACMPDVLTACVSAAWVMLLLQVRCRTGSPFNNGRPLRISDVIAGRIYNITDNYGRYWPGEQPLLGVAGCISACRPKPGHPSDANPAGLQGCVKQHVIARHGRRALYARRRRKQSAVGEPGKHALPELATDSRASKAPFAHDPGQ